MTSTGAERRIRWLVFYNRDCRLGRDRGIGHRDPGVLVSQQAAAGSERQAGDCRIRGRKSVQHGTVCHGR